MKNCDEKKVHFLEAVFLLGCINTIACLTVKLRENTRLIRFALSVFNKKRDGKNSWDEKYISVVSADKNICTMDAISSSLESNLYC